MAVTLRFDGFVLDPETGELRKDGALVKLKPQPTQVLALLASHPGAVVTREEIQKAIWPDETYVDFDLGINSCIRQIRIALGDEAEAPRYVQTLSKRGYRFLASLEPAEANLASDPSGEIADAVEPSVRKPLASPRANWRRALPWGIAAASLLVAAIALVREDAGRDTPVVRSEISPPPEAHFYLFRNDPGPPVLSPDGRKLAFSAQDADGEVRLYVRSLEEKEARALPGTERAAYPFWSPDGRWVGFFADRKLEKIDAAGEAAPLTLCDAVNGKGAAWSRDGVIVVSPDPLGPLHRVSASGGSSEPITELSEARGDNSHRHPRFLPDGRRFLFLARNRAGAERNVVMMGSLEGGEPKELVSSPVAATYASGYLLFLRGHTLMAQRLDVEHAELLDEATPIATDVLALESAALGAFTASQNDELVYLTGKSSMGGDAHLEWADRTGESQGILANSIAYMDALFPSPDGRIVVVPMVDTAGTYHLWLYDLERQDRSRFTFDPGNNDYPVWSHDGNAVIYAASGSGRFGIYRKEVRGTAERELLLETDGLVIPTSWSGDGKFVAFEKNDDIWVLSLENHGEPYPFLQTAARERWGIFSPDGRWMAYESNESGRPEVYVTTFPGPGRKWLVSTNGGTHPWWRQDGREMIYQEESGGVVAVEIEGSAEAFVVGAHTPLFDAPPPPNNLHAFFVAPMPEAQRFLLVRIMADQDPGALTLVTNWTGDLER